MDFDAYREPLLHTQRLSLEPLNAWHGEPLFVAGLKDPQLYVYMAQEPPLAVADLSRRFEKLESRRSPDGGELWLNWAVRLTSGGYAGLVEVTVHADRSASIAYFVFPAYQRQGIAGEAVAAVLGHLKAAGVGEARATVDTRNAASIGVLERLGFTRVATHLMHEKVRGRWVDDHEYAKAL